MSNILVSVIVPVYNVSNYLRRCIVSICGQTYEGLEIILVDDGSTDGSSELCDEIALTDDRIKVIHKKNGGLSSARNAGIDICTGDYVGFVDSDDWIEKNMYQCLLETNIKNKTSIACAGRYDVTEKNNVYKKKIGLLPEKDVVISSKKALSMLFTWETIDSSACDKLFKRELFEQYKFPEGKISEDVAVMYKIFDAAHTISLISKPLYNYYHHGNTITTKKFNEGKLHSLDHSAEIISFTKDKYPSLIDKAQYFRMKTLENILGSLISSTDVDFNKHKKLCQILTKEYRAGIKKRLIKRNKFRLIMKDMLFSHMRLVVLYRKFLPIIKSKAFD